MRKAILMMLLAAVALGLCSISNIAFAQKSITIPAPNDEGTNSKP